MPVLSAISSVVVDIADNEFGRFTIVRIQDLLIELRHQMLLQRLGGGNGIEKELAFLLVLVSAGAVATRLRHVIAPFLIELGQFIEFFLEFLIARR